MNYRHERPRLEWHRLTETERAVTTWASRGYKDREIVGLMNPDREVSVSTIRKHLRTIYIKLGIENRTELAYYAMRDHFFVDKESSTQGSF